MSGLAAGACSHQYVWIKVRVNIDHRCDDVKLAYPKTRR